MRYKDTLKASMKYSLIEPSTWELQQTCLEAPEKNIILFIFCGGTKCGRGPRTMSKAALQKSNEQRRRRKQR